MIKFSLIQAQNIRMMTILRAAEGKYGHLYPQPGITNVSLTTGELLEIRRLNR
ncbi:MAG: hypothetical protein LBV07_06045 [Syntrophobacterales bacterium]|nr:hypothetical protein [Syntrophobacterales bacterium]